MSSNSKLARSLVASLVACSPLTLLAAEVCAPRADTPLQFVDVFDGPVEDMATLVPDRAKAHSGHWRLGYVYKANRFVVVRCKYADGQTVDVKLANRVNRCDYKINAKKTLVLYCK
jgi:hypothetical protein